MRTASYPIKIVCKLYVVIFIVLFEICGISLVGGKKSSEDDAEIAYYIIRRGHTSKKSVFWTAIYNLGTSKRSSKIEKSFQTPHFVSVFHHSSGQFSHPNKSRTHAQIHTRTHTHTHTHSHTYTHTYTYIYIYIYIFDTIHADS